MADRKQLVSGLMTSLEEKITDKGLQKRTELAGYVLGTESFDSTAREAHDINLTDLGDTVDSTVTAILATEGYENVSFTAAQKQAAKYVAALALDPVKARAALNSLRSPDVQGESGVIDAAVLGTEDMLSASELSVEAYDNQAINSAIYFSITSSLMSATQDAFGEAFYPTITIDPSVSGANIECEFTSLYTEFTRGFDGAADGSKFKKMPIVKAIYDNDVFGSDKNVVIPVVRPENAAVLLNGLHSYVVNNGSEDVTTAPIAFGKKVGLLGLSQTDAMLAKGHMDNTDALDPRIVLDRVYFELTGDVSSTSTTEVLYKEIGMLPHSNFTYSTQDHNRDLSLSFSNRTITFVTGSTTTKTGAVSAVLAELGAGLEITMELVLHGDANVEHGDVVVYGSTFELVQVKDAAGNVLAPADAEYIAVKDVIDTATLKGYTVEAYRTNSNLRTNGQAITTDRYNQIYTVPLRTGTMVTTPVSDATGGNNDAGRLTSQIVHTGIRTSISAVKTLTTFVDMLNNVTVNGTVSNVALMGVGQYFVDAYFREENIVVSDVDSLKSSERAADIKANMVAKIRDAVIQMDIGSNYGIAYDIVNGNVGGKKTIILGTDPYIAQYLGGTVDIGANYDVKVVSTHNKLMTGKIIATFGIFDASRNTKAHPLNFGQCFWAPTVTTDVVKTINGETSRVVNTVPRYLHVTNLPIVTVFEVSGISAALGKVTQNVFDKSRP